MRSSELINSARQLVEVPKTIMVYYGNVQLIADVMYVNNVPFLILLSNYIHYSTATAIDNMKADTLELGLKNIIRCYTIYGFNIVVILLDLQFKMLRDRNKVEVTINIISKGE
jgi:hypothetical protein